MADFYFQFAIIFKFSVVVSTASHAAHPATTKEVCERNYYRVAFIKPFNYTDRRFVGSLSSVIARGVDCVIFICVRFQSSAIFSRMFCQSPLMVDFSMYERSHDTEMPCDSL